MREFDGANCGERKKPEEFPGEERDSVSWEFVFERTSTGVACYHTRDVAVAIAGCAAEREHFEAGDGGTS